MSNMIVLNTLINSFKESLFVLKHKPHTITHPPVCYRKTVPKIVPVIAEPERFQFKHTSPPSSTYIEDERIAKSLTHEFQKNREKAVKLLATAKAMANNWTMERKVQPILEEPRRTFKANKVPVYKSPLPIKTNTATLMRDAATIVKDTEKEIKTLEEVMSGAYDPNELEKAANIIRREEKEAKLREIERKHLEGLISYEEAVLARKRLKELNRERSSQLREEKEIWYKKIMKWREVEEVKLKQLVEKVQDIEKSAKEAERKIYAEKQEAARVVDAETKQLLSQAYMEKQKELEKKIQLIHELKEIHRLRMSLNVKEFVKNDTMNLGLLGEMSINELQEKLKKHKMEFQRELESRRLAITEKRDNEKRLIKELKIFITEMRVIKSKPLLTHPRRSASCSVTREVIKSSPEIVALRNRLEEVRKQRKDADSLKNF